ncbi:hypothetical protein L1987_08938 [Smallanthus sonchifolius]|uniref:Uncharacterized protein n=1 Tax=Smallanthus sonchifolius TaxID=185202 RepID=A0ACB9JMK5_9ASTR|nr:hypothetical protein L1987_08938 [Smallanthus sonchifolius]
MESSLVALHLLTDGTSFWHFMFAWSEIFTSKDQENHHFISRPPIFKRLLVEGSDPITSLPFTTVVGTTTVEDLMAHELGWAALRIHEAVANHNDEVVKKWVESWYRNPIVYKMNGLFHPNITHIGSSPRFDMYGCEFGLGKAVAARSGFVNNADGKMTMYPGREGGGSMDVEVCLLPEYMMSLNVMKSL